MSFNTDWDVEKYRSKSESDEHWELRRKFMLTHKHEFPEEKLICITQTFFNIEFLGCMYSKRTMDAVEGLATDVDDEHRRKKKARLQRTFVNASDAAGSKRNISRSRGQPVKQGFVAKLKGCESDEVMEILKNKKSELGLPLNFILLTDAKAFIPINILERSSHFAQMKLDYIFSNTDDNKVRCEVHLNGLVVGHGTESATKVSKSVATKIAVEQLQKNHFALEKKFTFVSSGTTLTTKSGSAEEEKPLPEDNVGLKMMLKMGWTGSGLGQNQQGIVAPVKATAQVISRAGLGIDSSLPTRGDMRNQFQNIFLEFAASDAKTDLVFSADLTPLERKLLHELAHKYKLKSQSFGKGDDRQLVISKPLNPRKIVCDLLISGQMENEKYKLIEPVNLETIRSG